MAKILDKDPAVYKRERDAFVRDLQHFHETRGTKFRRTPTINGHEIDLYLLYNIVTAKGGWVKVTNRNEWDGMLENFGLPAQCVNSGVALKQIYIRYLDRYEKVHFLGEEADRGSDDDEESRHKRWSTRAIHSVPLTYNHHQHNVAEANRTYNGLSADLYKSSEYDSLLLSLISPLPNEQDFAINVCTLLSNEGKHNLKLDKCPKIIEHLLAHAGVFNHDSLRPLFTEVYSNIREQSLNSFWTDTVVARQFLDLINESKFNKKKTILPVVTSPKKEPVQDCKNESKVEEDEVVSISIDDTTKIETNTSEAADSRLQDYDNVSQETSEKQNDTSVVNTTISSDESEDEDLFAPGTSKEYRTGKQKVRLKIKPEDTELFCTGRSLGTQEYVGQRVLQVANILRNLSFTEENVPLLANNITFLRFLLLCTSSRWNALHQHGFDMLSNIATELVVKDPVRDRLTECLLLTVTQGVSSVDRFVIVSCLDILNKLSQNEANEDVLIRYLEQNVYEQVCMFLTIQDIMLLIYTLECLYSLTSLGERACNAITNVHGVIDTLVSLITVEAQSYGPKACIGMKVVETIPTGVTVPAPPAPPVQLQPPAPPTFTNMNPPTIIPSAISMPAAPTAITHQILKTAPQTFTQVQRVSTPVHIAQPPVSIPQQMIHQQLTANSPNQNVQQQHAHQQAIQENENFACAWLRATFEPEANGRIEQQELYRNYLTSCSKIGRKGMIAPLHFPRIVRSIFGGTVGPNQAKFDNQYYYEGIKLRPTPLIITAIQTNVQNIPQPPRPITPVKTNRRPVKTPVIQTQPTVDSKDIIVTTPPPSPASPILKAQLSAPAKAKESPVKAEPNKSQVSAHPHLSQALLGSNTTTTVQQNTANKDNQPSTSLPSQLPTSTGNLQNSSSSLIKSLLATKVTQRQQRLLAQQLQSQPNSPSVQQPQQQTPTQINRNTKIQKPVTCKNDASKISRINGARSLQESDLIDSLVTSTVANTMDTQNPIHNTTPPPLAPLSTSSNKMKLAKMDTEDSSDSIGNNSVTSSSGPVNNVADMSTEENSLSSFDGILSNGIPNSIDIDASNDNSMNVPTSKPKSQSLMLADLLEKKIDKKDPPLMNGIVGKELRIGEKGLELVENHIERVLSKNGPSENNVSVIVSSENSTNIHNDVNKQKMEVDNTSLKRPAEDPEDVQVKRPHIASSVIVANNNINGKETETEKLETREENEVGSVSSTAANLYAALAADVLDEEDLDEVPEQPQPQTQMIEQNRVIMTSPAPVQQQPLIVHTANRPIIVSQAQIGSSGQVLFTAGGQVLQQQQMIKTPGTQTIVVQAGTGNQQAMQQQRVILSQQGMQLVAASGGPGGQYVISSGNMQGQTHYVMAQPQTALIQGQQQTVLVAQTSQQQNSGTKTIIILQPQTASSQTGQKIVMTPQGQQVVMSQVQRPVLQAPGIMTNTMPPMLVSSSNQVQSTVVTPVNTLVRSVQGVTQTVYNKMVSPCATVVVNSNNLQKVNEPQTSNSIVTVKNTMGQTVSASVNNNLKINKPIISRPVIQRTYPDSPYVCEWRGCECIKEFKSANEVLMHAIEAHCQEDIEELQCLWERCDNMRRKRFSLMTHLIDKHCNIDAMKASAARRKQLSLSGRAELPTSVPSTPHPGYAPDAAFHAIKRHALEFVNPKELMITRLLNYKQQKCEKTGPATPVPSTNGPAPADQVSLEAQLDDNEGPVTKSIRLTASLILRNLVIYSNNSKRYLRYYEPHLASVALSNVESSRTIAQVLYDLNDNGNRR